MNKLIIAAALAGLGLAVASPASAQSATAGLPAASGVGATPARAPDPRRANMTPEEIQHEQQMQLLKARTGLSTGNTSFGRAAGPARQYDTKTGGFTVRKFREARGTRKQKRGQMHPAGGANPVGKPLVHNHPQRKRFLFF